MRWGGEVLAAQRQRVPLPVFYGLFFCRPHSGIFVLFLLNEADQASPRNLIELVLTFLYFLGQLVWELGQLVWEGIVGFQAFLYALLFLWMF